MSDYGRQRVQRVQGLRRSNATVPVPGKRWEPTTATEAADESDVNEELTRRGNEV